jgi:tetratricopeptide (TPR) repeat protein
MSTSKPPAIPAPNLQILDLLPGPVRETFRRCAVPATFSRAMYEAHLRSPGGPDLELLAGLGQVERIPGGSDRYRLSRALGESALLDWWRDEQRLPALELPVPARLRELAEAVADAFEPDVSRLERLSVTLLHDPERAGRDFQVLYADADGQHDLARCRAILDVFDAPDRLALLSPELAALRNEYATYLAARTFWVDDYYRSAYYVSRAGAELAIERLLAPDGPRILQLYARGGMGKSTQLRWLIARRAVPSRIPCARIDFDTVHPQVAARLPWLILLEAAAQLDRQLTGNPFQELLAAHGRYRALLPQAPAAGAEAAHLHTMADDREDVTARFCAIVQELPPDRPVVLVLDTVEEMLRPSVNPAQLIRLIEELVASSPAMRVVLAGRYDLLEPGRPTSGLAMASVKLEPLTAAEQDRYLTEIRGITDPELVAAVRWLCRGLPMALSLYANLVSEAQAITTEELRSCDDPGLLSAVTRVVKRVTDQRVRWLLRYGVIPRRLSFDFVQTVMWPYLREGMSGRSTVDAPEQDNRLHDPDQPVFRTDVVPPRDDAELHEVWEGLLAYAADYGWVSVEPDGAVAFRSDLQEPLRRLIEPHEVFNRLQRDAVTFFEAKAAAAPENWVTWKREEIFHWLYVDTEAAERVWRDAIEHASSVRRGDWCLDLATDLLGREFVDWNGEPIPPMTHALLATAHLERARAAASLAEERMILDEDRPVTDEDPLWNDVADGLAAASALAGTHPEIVLPGASVVRARLSLARGDARRAEEVLLDQRNVLKPSRELADLERTLGQAQHRLRKPDAAEHLDTSYQLAVQTGDLAGAQLSTLMVMDRWVELNRYAEALDALHTARAGGAVSDPDDGDDKFGFVESLALAASGDLEQGRRRAKEMLAHARPAQAHLALALVALFGEDPLAAIESCGQALRYLEEDPGPDLYQTEFVRAMRGKAWADVHAYDRAIDDLMAAASIARARRNLDGAAEHAADAALILIRISGDLHQASQCLEEAERSAPAVATLGWAKAAFARAALERGLGRVEYATAVLQGARQALADADVPPAVRVAAALATLTLPLPSSPANVLNHRNALAELVEQLSGVTPAGARWWMLADLRYVPSLVGIDRSACRELVALVEPPGDDGGAVDSGDVDSGDDGGAVDSGAALAAQEWCWAEALRVAGEPAQARRVLDQALHHRGSDLLGWWRWLHALTRLGPPEPDEPTPPPELTAGPSQTPTLAAACLITLARRRLPIDPPELTQERLDAAASLLPESDGRPTVLVADLALLRAELDRRRDQGRSATRHAAEAAGLLSRLGATVERDQVANRYVLGAHAPPEEPSSVEIHFAVRRTDVTITIRRAGRPDVVGQASLEGVGGMSFQHTQARIRHVIGPLKKGWRTWSTEIAEQILDHTLRRLIAPEGRGRDVRIVSESRELAAWPWELSRAWDLDVPLVCAPGVSAVYRSLPAPRRAEAMVRALQAALGRVGYFTGVADGLIGQHTMDALRRFQREVHLTAEGTTSRALWAALRQRLATIPRQQPNVVLLRPNPERELEKQRGSDVSGTELVSAYLRAGFTVDVLYDLTPNGVSRFARSGSRPKPDLVHIFAPVRYASGATVLDLGDGAGSHVHSRLDRSGELTVTRLCELLALLAHGGRVPLVVLDVPLPMSPAEALRSLGVRNNFSHQLLHLAQVDAILATGLAGPHDRREQLGLITEGLGMGVASLLHELHHARTGKEDIGSVTAFLGSALFADRPPYALLPLG